MFNIFGSDKKTSTTNTTTSYQHTDESANAGGNNSVAIGSGASVSIQTSDPATVARALSTVDSGLSASLSTVNNAEQQGTVRYLASLEAIRSDADASRRSEESVLTAAQSAIDSNNALAAQLASQVADSKKDPNNQTLETVAKYGTTAFAIIAAAALVVYVLRKK